MKKSTTVAFIKELKAKGIRVSAENNELDIKAPKGSMTNEIISELRDRKPEILSYFTGGYMESTDAIRIDKVPSQPNYAISDAQRRLWVLSQFDEGSIAYNIPGSIYLDQEINIENFKKAIISAVERHEVLRTVFKADDFGEIRQWIWPIEDLGFEIGYVDLQNTKEKHEAVTAYIRKDTYAPFDLENGPLLRATLLQTEANGYVFSYNMHHIISDGWSMGVLSKDIFAFYEAFQENKINARLSDLPIQYKDYSTWQLDQLETGALKKHEKYWLNELSGELPLLVLPSNRRRPKLKTHNGQALSTYINPITTDKIRRFSQENGGSLFMGLLTAWHVLMYRYTSQNDVIIGSPVAGRDHVDLEDQIGFYVNTLAIRNTLNSEDDFVTFYQNVKDKILTAYKYQAYPFDRLVDKLNIQRDVSRSAIFDLMLTLQNTGEKTNGFEMNESDLERIIDTGFSASKFDLSITFKEVGDYLSFHIVYNSDIYENEMVEGLIKHFKQLLNALLANPSQQVSTLDYLSTEEKQKLTSTFNAPDITYPSGETIIDLFEEQVLKTPTTIAVTYDQTSLTYDELNQSANQLAHFLRDTSSIQANDLVGIKQSRDHWMIISVLAVLKSGGAYVPIDPEYPQERIDYIMQDANCKICLDEKELNKFKAKQSNYPTDRINLDSQENNLAYIIYTSGSTGKPKGVMIDHKNAYSFIKWSHGEFENSDFDSVLFTTSLNFDLSVFEIFHTLTRGKELRVLKDGLSIPNQLDSGKKMLINTVPSVIGSLLQQGMRFESVSVLNMAGEPIPAAYKEALKGKVSEIRNLYGPSEDTTYSTCIRVDKDDRDLIGKPISNTQIYILNEEGKLQPRGVVGEICLSGAGVARGYLNQPELTAEKFISNPFKEGSRLYKTGDLGRYLADGNLELVGRKDDQVKIRGYRIELGEIENALAQNKEIEQVVLIAKENDQKEKELVAYLTAKTEQKVDELRNQLSEHLPAYMIPAYFVQLKELPLTANGKIDKKALPNPEGLGISSGQEYLAARNDLEKQLVAIWEAVLERDKIGVKDDFFALGGHSLKAIRLLNEYQKKCDITLSLTDVFTHTNIASHGTLIESSNKQNYVQIEKLAPQESYAISDAQRRLWVLSQFEQGSIAYNIPGSIFLDQQIDTDNFKKAIKATIARHEVLRTVFKEDQSGQIKQWILEPQALDFKIDYQDFRKVENKQDSIDSYLTKEAATAFDLENGPLLRAALLQIDDQGYVFSYNMHHIISDDWSINNLSKDVFEFYEAFQENKKPRLETLRIQYKDYSAWQLAQLERDAYTEHKNYWLDHLSGELPQLNLPSTKLRPKIKTNNGRTLSTFFNKELGQSLKAFSQANGGTVFMGLLASLNALFYRYTGNQDLIIGSPMAGRDHADLTNQIGFYLNTLALRNQVTASESFHTCFSNIKANTLSAYAHQHYPFDRLVEDLDLRRDTSRNPVFDVLLVYLEEETRETNVDLTADQKSQIIDKGSKTSKFDLTVFVKEQGDRFSFSIEYNTDVYEGEMIENLMVHYQRLLSVWLLNPEEALENIDYLSAQERTELLETFNNTAVDYGDKTVMELFEAQVLKTPNQIALVFENETRTYQELNAQSNRLAHHLRNAHQISNNSRVGVMLERSIESVIAMFGIMKTGACYVPIDHNYPESRVAFIVKDSNADVIISQQELANKHIVIQDDLMRIDEHDLTQGDAENLKRVNELKDESYIIYTSGSTGQPKGVAQTHLMMSNLIQWDIQFSGLDRTLKHLQYASFNFDASLQDYWTVLCAGGTSYLTNEAIRLDFNELWSFINDNGIEVMTFPFSAFRQLIHENSTKKLEISNLKHTVCTGEQLIINPAIQNFLEHNPQLNFHNHYGPSETHVVTSYSVNTNQKEIDPYVSIGKPVSNSCIYILDKNQNLVPKAVEGEVYVGGSNLALGYLNRKLLTEERFVQNPFKPDELLYKTGDIAKWLSDGNITYLGRKDDQIKIRGYRVELEEIERTLLKHHDIEQAVVVLHLDDIEDGEKNLAAYITAKTIQNASDLRAHLNADLPAYMLPTYFVQLEELPLTSNGKIDKRALPNPTGLGLASAVEYVAPRNELEKKLIKIWKDVLQHDAIGVKDDFFDLGGHSIKAIKMISEYLKTFEVKLSISDLFTHTTLDSHGILIKSATKKAFVQIPVLDTTNSTESYAISDAQRRLWVLSQFSNTSIAYNIPSRVFLNEQVNIENFKKAIISTIERHEILRTVLKEVNDENYDGEIRQWVISVADLGFKIDQVDFREVENNQEKVESYINEQAYKAFDIEHGPLLRASLIQVEDEQYIFSYTLHHIISDGWSMEVLSQDVLNYYQAYQTGSEPNLKPLRIQYKDYSAWQLAQLQADSFKIHEAYWLNNLSGELPILNLPTTKQRPNLKTVNGRGLATYINKEVTDKLKNYSKKQGGSIFMGLLASWNLLMSRYTSDKDIIIGTPIAAREHPDLENQIGFYANTLALRNKIDLEESFDAFYARLKENTLNAYSHQMYPFDRLVEELDLNRDTSRNPIFDVMLMLQNNADNEEEIVLTTNVLNGILDLGDTVAKFDLTVTFEEVGDYLAFSLNFNQDVYDQETMEGLMRHYKVLLSSVLDNSSEKMLDITFLSSQENKLLNSFNKTTVDFPTDKTILDLFEIQVAQHPNDVALVFKNNELTYGAVDELSNQLAHYLMDQHTIHSGDLIGIKLERTPWMIISILGILKSGGAYLPIDPTYPQQRIDFLIANSNCLTVIDQAFVTDLQNQDKPNFTAVAIKEKQISNPCAVIYTSGSTGKPKGVIIPEINLLNRLYWMWEKVPFEKNEVCVAKTSLSFVDHLWEIFGPLLSGVPLVLLPKETVIETEDFINALSAHKVSRIVLVPSLLKQMLYYESACVEKLQNLKEWSCSGERLDNELVNQFYNVFKSHRLVNIYGSTEVTADALYYDTFKNGRVESLIESESIKPSVPIGLPISNATAFILDEYEKLVPINVVGEICIGGNGVTAGYLNQPELTAEKFIDNPFTGEGHLYKTGDLGRRLGNGIIEFVGRKDDQVKIRGHRIELGEIAHALSTLQSIENVVVSGIENDEAVIELVAYFTADEEQKAGDLRSYLKSLLPDYMLPTHYVQLDAFKRTSSGKVDKTELPNPAGLGLNAGFDYVAPSNEFEIKLVTIWENVLMRDRIGINDDFFVLGGHSLKAVRLSNEYQKEFAVKLSLQDLFSNTNIITHANLIKAANKSVFVEIERIDIQANYGLSDAQRRLWVLSQFEKDSSAYNITGSIYLNQGVDIDNFKKAIYAVLNRHEILRTVFKEDEYGELKQWVLPLDNLGFEINYQDFRTVNGNNKSADQLETYISEDSYKIFDLANGPLLRATLLHVAEEEYVFYYNMHHIISDGWSMGVLSKDIFTYYEAFQDGHDPKIDELRIQYKDYSAWQLTQVTKGSNEVHKNYWLTALAGELPYLTLPFSKLRPRVKTNNGGGLNTFLNKEITHKLKHYSQTNGGSLFMGLLAMWKVLMYRYTAETDLIVGTAIAGREHADLEDQIGFYVNTLALRNQIDPAENFATFFDRLRQNTLDSYKHQMYPFDRLVEDLDLQRNTSRNAIFDVMLTLQNSVENGQAEISNKQLTEIRELGYLASKFDLSITFGEHGDCLSFHVEYNSDLYESERIADLMRHYKQLLHVILDDPNEKIGKLKYLSAAEETELLVKFNDTSTQFPNNKTIVELFESKAIAQPENIALVFQGSELTYGELNIESNKLAHYLHDKYKVQANDLVAIKQERSAWMLISILGVLKSGAAYVPVDPTYPQERIDYIEKDANCKVCLDDQELDNFKSLRDNYASDSIIGKVQVRSTNLAYVIYTSGSTGAPKGVMVEHQAIVNTIHSQIDYLKIEPGYKGLQFASFSFDASIWETLIILLSGGQLYIADEKQRKDPDLLASFIQENAIDLALLSPSYLNKMSIDKLDGLKLLISGGEAAHFQNGIDFHQHGTYYNAYGPTEASVYGTIFKLENPAHITSNTVPIGKPIANMQVYILNENELLQSKGIIGEICLGGSGLAKGYLNQDKLTHEKFIPNPFLEGERLYKTGDLGRWLPDGNIEFIGRIDDQVKIRGYRIELGEIEFALVSHPEINEAVVGVKHNAQNENELVAYFTASDEQNLNDLRSHLKVSLPEYMLPTFFVQLDQFPLTSNGKIDKKALPNPIGLGLESGVEYIAPQNDVEKKLVGIWAEILQREKIGTKDDFFMLGGNSISAMKIIVKIQTEFSVKIDLADLFDEPTISKLSACIDAVKLIENQSDFVEEDEDELLF